MNDKYGSLGPLGERYYKRNQEIYRVLHKDEIEAEERKKAIERKKQTRRDKLRKACIGIAIALVNISAILLLLFSKEAAMIAFIIGIVLPLVVGLGFCAWMLAKEVASSLTKTIILSILIFGAMVGGIYLISNVHWGNKPRMEQIDSQRPDKF